MAASGSFTTSACEGRSLTFSWSIQSQSVENNTTTISWSLKGSGSYSGYVMGGPFTVVINGSTVYSSSSRIEVWAGSTRTTTVASGTTTIGHNSDGTKSFSASVSAAIYSYSVNCTGRGSWSLTTIPRASSFGTISGNTIGSSMTVNISRNSSSFTHRLLYKLGDSSWYNGGTGLSTSTTFTINDDLLSQLPSATSGTLQLRLTTYNGNTQIGSDVYKNVTVYVATSEVPKVGTITLNPVDINNQNILVQSKNKLTISVSGCTPGTGSSIKSYTFSGPGISSTTTSTSVTSGLISDTGKLTYTVKVTDNRGRTASGTAKIECHAWSAPSITLNAYRVASNTSTTENDNGTFVRCTYNVTYSSVNNTNDVTVEIHYKKSSASSYSSVTAFDNKTDESGNYTLSDIDVNSTYTVYATVTDNYSGQASSSQITIFGASRILNITKDGTGVAFGKMAENNNMLESKYIIKAPGLRSSRDGRNNTDLNIVSDNEHANSLEYYIVKGATTANAPSADSDGHIIHCHWDYTNGYDAQLYLRLGNGEIKSRGCNAATWGAWRTSLDSANYTSWVAPKPVQLYSTSTGNTGTVTLSESAANFTYLEIFYTDNNNRQPNSIKVYSPNGKYISLSCIEPSTNGTEARVYVRASGWTISGTSMTVGRSDLSGGNAGVYGQIYPHANGTNIDAKVTANNYIKIFRVLGYK